MDKHTAHIDYVMGSHETREHYLVTVHDGSGAHVAHQRFYSAELDPSGATALTWAQQWVAAWYPDADVVEG